MGILCLFHPIFKGGLSNTEFERLLLLFFPLFDYGCYSLEWRWFFMARTGSECFFWTAQRYPPLFSFVSIWRRSGSRDGVHDFHWSRSCKLRYPHVDDGYIRARSARSFFKPAPL